MKKIVSVIIALLILCLSINICYAEDITFAGYDGPLVDTLGPIEKPDGLVADKIFEAIDYSIKFDETVEGTMSENCEKVEYFFELDESGTVFVKFSSESILGVYLNIYDKNGEEVWDSNPWQDSKSEYIAFNEGVELTAGAYNFYVSEYSGYGDYELELSFESANESFLEEQNGSNNTFKTADEIDVNEEYTGHLAENDKSDNYIFTLEQSGGIDLTFITDGILGVYLTLYDENGQKIWDYNPWWDSTSKHIAYEQYLALTSGTYFFNVSEYSGVGAYDFELSFTATEESFEEEQNGNNNSFKEAIEIECNSYYIGQIANNDKIDIYSFSINDSGNISLLFTAYNMYGAYLDIYDDNGKELWSANPWWNSTTEEISCEELIELQEGIYYLSISENSGVGEYEFAVITDSIFEENDAINDENAYSESNNEDDNAIDSNYDDIIFNASDWAYTEVEEAHKIGIIPEEMLYDDLHNNINREKFAAVAVKLYENMVGEVPHVELDDTPFTDCDYDSEYSCYIAAAYELGITTGTSETTFSPYDNISREQLATMLFRVVKLAENKGIYTLDDFFDINNVRKFYDDADISAYAKESVYFMAEKGIIKGVDGARYAPLDTATKEQAILISYRCINILLEN